jgi:GTP pyrophosphokinase
VPFLKSDKKKSAEAESKEETGTGTLITVGKDFNKKKPVYVTEDNITGYVFPTCCHAIPGDDILGFIDNDGHIDIHLRQCQVANKLKSSYGNRIVDAKWDMHKTLYFDARIQIRGIDRIGMLLDVTNVITTQMNVNIRKIVISCNDGIFDGIIDMGVHDRDDVKLIMENLRDIRGLQEILSVDME